MRVAAGSVLAVLRRPLVALVVTFAAAGSAHADDWATLQDGAVVLMRHAEAPGIGDPPGLRLGQCGTQRNLDAAGRAQARRVGQAFRAHGVHVGAVLASQWCRTHETAQLAFPGRVQDDPRFNSFFGDSSDEPAQTAAAAALLRRWKGPGVLVVVTHQVNITALTGVVPAAGESVVLRPAGDRLDEVGRLRP